ncbi:MAG: DUF167 domain-containing protein [Alphaproteobacteria bacterium]
MVKDNILHGWKEKFGVRLCLRVTPKASANRIKLEYAEDGSPIIRVYVTTVPEDGKANEAVIKLLAKELGVAKSSITITHGLHDRHKVIVVSE